MIPPPIRKLDHITKPLIPKDAHDLLLEGPVEPDDIDSIILSHLHFDHVGDCTTFPAAKIIAGPGSRRATTPGWPVSEKSPFSSSILQHDGYSELLWPQHSIPIGSFTTTLDYFGDGSFYLLDAPGHMPGHIAGLALISPGHWVFFGGDCCHHRALLDGIRPISTTCGPTGPSGFHKDSSTASETIDKIRELEATGSVFVALAHDHILDGVIPVYPHSLNGWEGSSWGEIVRKKTMELRKTVGAH